MKAAIVTAAGRAPIYADFDKPVANNTNNNKDGEDLITMRAAALSKLTRARASGALEWLMWSGWRGVVALPSEKSFHCGGRVPGQETGAVIVRTVWHGFDEKSIVVMRSELPRPDELRIFESHNSSRFPSTNRHLSRPSNPATLPEPPESNPRH